MKRILLTLLLLVLPGANLAWAGGYAPYYYRSGNTIYYRTYHSRPCSYGSRCYTTYYYKDAYVTDSSKPDWKVELARVANTIQNNAAFNEALSKVLPNIPVVQQAPGYAQQSPLLYPSAQGNTIGGFSAYNYQRYGDVKAIDVNRAIELNQQGTDNVTRMAQELGQLSNGVAVQAVALQNLNGERVGAIAEAQELRQGLREMQQGLASQMLAQADLMRAIRPASSESFNGQSQGPSTYLPGTAPGTPPAAPGAGGPFQSPQPPGGPATPLFAQFCGACHGPQASAPAGGWAFNGQALDAATWGNVYLRIDPNTAVKTADGRPLRMPPESSTQPSVEQRRALVQELRAFVQL